MENCQAVAVVEIANLQSRPRKKAGLLPGSRRTSWAAGYVVLLFIKHVRTREVKCRRHVEAGFEVRELRGVPFIHPRYLISS